jgi:N6-adenosine-specific RNA methylase IME4
VSSFGEGAVSGANWFSFLNTWDAEHLSLLMSLLRTFSTLCSHYVTDAKKIVEKAPKLKNAILTGAMTIPEAKRQLKDQERSQRRAENRETIAQARTIEEALGCAKFSTIVVDPPWDWGDEGDGEQMGRAMPVYGTMPLEELLALPVGRYADEDCHLYLWITNRSLPKGSRLLETWGFRYVTCITWVKPSFGMGTYFRGQTEHLLFGVKGSQALKRRDAGTVLQAPRGPGGHSSKPREIYPFIESCSPGPYLELFARSERPDWTSWGAEV